MQSFSFNARGRKYTVTTEALDTAFSMTGYWLYGYSVVKPCALTGGKYVLVMARNKTAHQNETHGTVVVARTSDDGITFGSETTILDSTSVDNVCDMAEARVVWDGSQWHIYVQVRTGTSQNCPGTAHICEAVRSSLNPPGTFQWVKDSGTNNAKKIFTGTGSTGIGSKHQWYNPSQYGLPAFPFMVTYQDWGCVPPTDCPDCGQNIFNYLSEDDSTYDYWYGENCADGEDNHAPVYSPDNWELALFFPDVILLGSLDAGRRGLPGIGFESQCPQSDHTYSYEIAIGFFNNPSKVPSTAPHSGLAFGGSFESVASDSHGPKMLGPRVARNEYGYLPPKSYHGNSRTWETFMYYTYTLINATSTDDCGRYTGWDSATQSVGVSRLTITEETGQR